MNKYFKIFTLIAGLAAIATFTFYLYYNYNSCMIFTEPNTIIRNTEIVIGLISLSGMTAILYREVKDAIPQEKER